MKYPKITALVPQGEEFTGEAVNEGIWLTGAHVGAIEAQLAGNETAAATAATALTAANTAKKTAEDGLTAANATIATQKAEIEALQAKVAKLEKKPATEPTATVRNEDVPATGTKVKNKYETSIDREAREMFS